MLHSLGQNPRRAGLVTPWQDDQLWAFWARFAFWANRPVWAVFRVCGGFFQKAVWLGLFRRTIQMPHPTPTTQPPGCFLGSQATHDTQHQRHQGEREPEGSPCPSPPRTENARCLSDCTTNTSPEVIKMCPQDPWPGQPSSEHILRGPWAGTCFLPLVTSSDPLFPSLTRSPFSLPPLLRPGF